MSKPEFKGELAQPVQIKGGSLLQPIDPEQAVADALQEAEDKMPLLMAHYGIDKMLAAVGLPADDLVGFRLLAVELAREFVPGFQIESGMKRGVGAPKKWTMERYTSLWGAILNVQRGNRALSGPDAVKHYWKRIGGDREHPHWTGKASTLVNYYRNARNPKHNPIARLVSDMPAAEFQAFEERIADSYREPQ